MKNITCFVLTLCFLASCSSSKKVSEETLNGRSLVRASIDAHGGIDAWRKSGALKFRWIYNMSDLGKVVDTVQIVDPVSMDAIHTVPGTDQSFGHRAGQYWASPSASNFAPPARFWTLTPFYFIGIPFVFDDDNANFEILSATKTFQGQEYIQVKVSYEQGVGDSPDDYYVLLIDPNTELTRGAYYTVTSPLVNKTGEIVEKFITLDDLSDVNGLKLAGSHSTYTMQDGVIQEKLRSTEIRDTQFLARGEVDFSIPKGATFPSSN